MKPCFIVPSYIAPNTLPYAADILYHKRLIYSMPTGFHPIELSNVYFFPEYCRKEGIALPKMYWNFCEKYFLNTKLALDCIKILDPLRVSGNIKIVQFIYSRGIKAISDAAELVDTNPDINNSIANCPLSIPFIARELLSHVLYEVYLEKDSSFKEVVAYLQQYQSVEQILKLVYAVLVNRFKMFAHPKFDAPLMVYHPEYVNILTKLNLLMSGSSPEASDQNKIDQFTYTLFSQLLLPIYGTCDSLKKNHIVAIMCKEKSSEIDQLIEECRFIASDILFLQTQDNEVKKQRLAKLIQDRIMGPLSEFCEKEKAEASRILTEFVTESGIIATLLSLFFSPSPLNLLLSVAAAGTSTVLRHVITPRVEPRLPTKFLLDSLRKMKHSETLFLTEINKISSSIDFTSFNL